MLKPRQSWKNVLGAGRLIMTRSATTNAGSSPSPKEAASQNYPSNKGVSKLQEALDSQTQPSVSVQQQDREVSEQKKSAAQLDEELRRRMADLAGDGGDAGIEYEDGQPVAMKRSVRENMFRYI